MQIDIKMERKLSNTQMVQKRKRNCIIDLNIKRSIGVISSMEFKRRSILNEINHIVYACDKSSNSSSSTYINNFVHDNILHMELDPRESRCLITISRYNILTIYHVSQDVEEFENILRITIPHYAMRGRISPPNSIHWLWDGTIFSIGLMNSIHFYDTATCRAIETINMRTEILNHVIAAKKYSVKKYVAATGIEGHVYIIDMLHGIIVMTMKNVEKTPMRAICWHPTKESYYATGNEIGNIHLWDLRFQKQFVSKLTEDNNFSKKSSHPCSVIGLHFYNNGNSIISVDDQGGIKSWETNTGRLRPNYYENIQLNDYNKRHICKNYQFAVTENLKEDIAFLPSNTGMKILDIENCKQLPNLNDSTIPVHCATYDSKNICVYGSTNDIVKLWSSQRKN